MCQRNWVGEGGEAMCVSSSVPLPERRFFIFTNDALVPLLLLKQLVRSEQVAMFEPLPIHLSGMLLSLPI